MNADILKDKLQQKFEILCFEDLGVVFSTNTGIYKIFKKLYQESYNPNQRLVFYSAVPVDQNIINHIINASNLVDVSTFFILICCPNDISSYISTVDISTMQVTVDGKQWNPETFYQHDKVCPLPWMHLNISNNGQIRPCCVYRGSLDNINTASINSVFDNQLNQLREQMLSGEIPSGCQYCWQTESTGQISNRTRALDTFSNLFWNDLLDNPRIISLDIRGGITCNMKCRICSPNDSSMWADEVAKNKNISLAKSDWSRNDSNWSQVMDLMPDCINIDFFGGEPLLSKQIVKLLEYAIEVKSAPNMRLNFNTNGSIWNSEVITLANKFKKVNIGISIDDIGDRFEVQRGSSWTIVENNVKKFLNLDQTKFHIYLYTTVNIQNVYYLDQLLSWANSVGIEVMFSCLERPEYLNIDYMTPSAKKLVCSKLLSHEDSRLKSLAGRIMNSQGSDGHKWTIFQNNLDQIRSQDFNLSHKEIAIAMSTSV